VSSQDTERDGGFSEAELLINYDKGTRSLRQIGRVMTVKESAEIRHLNDGEGLSVTRRPLASSYSCWRKSYHGALRMAERMAVESWDRRTLRVIAAIARPDA
jgi:hypothetical protein